MRPHVRLWASPDMLWVCLHFPQLALDVFEASPALPLVIEQVAQQQRLAAFVSPAAARYGIDAGMSIPAAYGLCETLQVKPRNETLEQHALQRVALLSYQFTPHIVLCPPDSVLLEIETSLRLFGGCMALLDLLRLTLAEREASLHCAIACFPAAKGAQVLARACVESGQAMIFPLEALNACPLAYTDLPSVQVKRLSGIGLTTLGEVFALPTAAVGKRFGQGTLFYLQQLRGQHPDPRPHYTLPPQFQSGIELGHETGQLDALLFPLRRLLLALESYLCGRQLVAASLTLALKRRDLSGETLVLAPTQGLWRCSEWLSLFKLRFEQHRLSQPVIALSIAASVFYPWAPLANDLFDTPEQSLTPEALVDRLQARLGLDRVSSMRPVEDYRPERAWQQVPPGQGQTPELPPYPRPLWLLNAPRPLATKNGLPWDDAPLTLLQGPERIDSGWWDQQAVARDYFVARHANGTVYWVFQPVKMPGLWFLHGIFT